MQGEEVFAHCSYNYEDAIFSTHEYLCDGYNSRFATEEEKQKLFDAIKVNGYKWNAETKTLEKISKALELKVSYLIVEDDEKNTLTCPKCGARFKLEE